MSISFSTYCGYFEYVKSCETMLLLYESPCLNEIHDIGYVNVIFP